jgi:hypothetical protein
MNKIVFMSKTNTPIEKRPSGETSISQDDQHVFELLAEAEKRLLPECRQWSTTAEYDYQFPSPDSYNWENPLNLVLTGH